MRADRICLLVCLSMLAACSTIVAGPEPPFRSEQFESKEFLDVASSFKTLASAASESDRDAEINRLLAFVDGRYAIFLRQYVLGNRHGLAAAKSVLNAATIAGGLTNSKGVKDNWLALAQLVTGEQLIYDKTYLNDQSLSTIVAQMNAGRKQKLLEIRQAMASKSITDYPGQMALVDILDYHGAGTPMGAALYAERAAGAEATTAEAKLRTLDDVQNKEIIDTHVITARLHAFVQALTPEQESDLKVFLAAQGIKLDPAVDDGDPAKRKNALGLALKRLHDIEFRHTGDELIKRLQNARFNVP